MKKRIFIFIIALILTAAIATQANNLKNHQTFAHPSEPIIRIANKPDTSISSDTKSKQLSALEDQFNWEIQVGDWLDINVKTNTMVIRRKDNSESSQKFQIGSGLDQDENIIWAGVTYNPRTPADNWIIKEKNQQNLYWVFGTKEKNKYGKKITEQLFLRMYRNDSKGNLYRTKYGFHATPEIEDIIANKNGYGSYGCLLARYKLLKFIEQIYDYQISQGEEGLRLITNWDD